ncbi:hypothetical protein [Kitasatospora sp. NPDC017646]|uniref:hypothetical protein n=1 Tax=Kitasatospora sp. NPDC017646 TaxID=3364024 RepID=UPI0037A071B7
MALNHLPAHPPRHTPPRWPGDSLLPCGHLLSHAWDDQTTAAACPSCRQARQGLAETNRAVHALTATPPSPPAGLMPRVLAAVRAHPHPGRLLPLPSIRPTHITEANAAKALRHAVDTTCEALAASCRLTPLSGGEVAITMTLLATYDRPLPGQADTVRRTILTTAHRDLGLSVRAVDLCITDLVPGTDSVT